MGEGDDRGDWRSVEGAKGITLTGVAALVCGFGGISVLAGVVAYVSD